MAKKDFRCIHCLERCETLYRRIGKKDVKLTVCNQCNECVDPYCERDLFLLCLDIVLLRQQAFRHMLYNFDLDTRDVMKILVLGSVLRAHIGMIAKDDEVDIDETIEAAQCFVKMTTVSILASMSTVGIVGFLIRRLALIKDYFVVARAILIPLLLLISTATVHFWENTETIRMLSSLLIATYRWISFFSLLRASNSTYAVVAIAVVVAGLLTVVTEVSFSVTASLLWSIVSRGSLPCPGVQLSLVAVAGSPMCIG